MPIYEYRCPNGHTFEIFQKFAEAPVQVCAICGAGPVEKILFPVAVHFKGSGFYSTDYGRGNKKAKEGDSAPAEKSADKPADKQAEKSSSEKKPSPPTSD
ncbi:MAG: zinc ribbon domain-containing protein [Gaiellaceae bacterium]